MWIRHLPAESALARRHIAGEVKPTDQDRLQAGVINELRRLNYMFHMANSSEDVETPEPNFIELPD